MATGYFPPLGGGSGSDDVTATKAQVLFGYTAITSDSNDEPGDGSMVDNGAVSHSLAINGTYTIPAGYHNGNGKVTQSISTLAGGTYKSTTSNQTISCSGKYMTSNIVVQGDGNLVAGNILNGKSILGVAGNVRKYGYYHANVTSSSSTSSFSTGSGNRNFYYLGLNPGFTMLVITAMVDGAAHNSACSCGNYGVEVRNSNDGSGYMVNMNPQGTSKNIPVITKSKAYKTSIAGYY